MALFSVQLGNLNSSSEYLTSTGEKLSGEVHSKKMQRKGVNIHESYTIHGTRNKLYVGLRL